MYNFRDDTVKNKFLIILTFLMIIYSGVLVYCQSIIGVNYWDIFVYLENAMLFSHVNIGSQLSVPPVLSLLTSIPFSLGFISENSLFVICGILFVFLVIGIYLLFNETFSPEESFIGSLIFSMLSLVVTWAVSGSNDLPALCFGVWAVIFTIRGLNVDFKYFYLALSFFVLAFFTRFTMGFILLIMLFYLLINFNVFKKELNKKNIVLMIIYALVLLTVISAVYISYQGTIPFISQIFEVSSSSQVSNVNVGYELNPYYYVSNLPQFLTSWGVDNYYFTSLSTVSNSPTFLSYVIMGLSGLGLLIFVLKFVKIDDENVNRKYLKMLTIIILSVLLVITYTHVSYIISEIIFMITVYLFYMWIPENDDMMDYVMFLWMGIFIILHSYHPVKVDRYILPILIPLIYFMINSIKQITKNKKYTLTILTILLILIIPINISYTQSITQENPHTQLEKESSQWIKDNNPEYKTYNISSDRGVAFSWYLKKYTYSTIPRVLKTTNESLEDKLNQIKAKYYIDSTSNITNITGYHIVHEKNNGEFQVKIFERD